MTKHWFHIVLILLWNPITLSILLHSIGWGVAICLFVWIIGAAVSNIKSLRLKVWAFNIAAILSICYHAELLFRVFGADNDIPNLYELHNKFYFNKPYLDQKFETDEYCSLYRTNCQGFRIDEQTNADDSIKKCDWLFIGDSFTQGAQVDYEYLFTSLLYKSFPDKTIINAGISGAGLYEELNFYKEIGLKLHPKKVFLQIGVFNDFKDIKEHRSSLQDYIAEKSSLYRYISYKLSPNDETPLGRWMEPFFLNLQDNIDSNILYKSSSAKKEKDKDRFATCISEFKRIVESSGAELVLILIPSKEQISPHMLKETLQICKLKENDVDLQAANRLCAEVAQKEGLTLIDMYDDFRVSSLPFFLIDEHLNVLGHELIASRLVAEYENISHAYDYLSLGNYGERYPTLLADSVSLLYQSRQNRKYSICRRQINSNTTETLLKNFRELIHPSYSPSQDALLFTVGNQDKLQTEVILLDFANGKKITLNDAGCSASIPMFNYDGGLIAFPQWGQGNTKPYIKLYDVVEHKEFARFSDGIECWRPIFSKGDSVIYYISKATENSKFAIKSYGIKNGTKTMLLKMPYDIWDIALSPSGKYIAYAGNKDGNWDLFLFNIETQQVTQLTKSIGNEWDPSFGHGDDELFFAGEFGINNGIYRLKIAQ